MWVVSVSVRTEFLLLWIIILKWFYGGIILVFWNPSDSLQEVAADRDWLSCVTVELLVNEFRWSSARRGGGRWRKKLIWASETGLSNLEFFLSFSKCYNSSKHHIAALCSSDFWFSFIYVWDFDRDLIISQLSDNWLNASGSDLVSSNETLNFSSCNSVFHIWLAMDRAAFFCPSPARVRQNSNPKMDSSGPEVNFFFSPNRKICRVVGVRDM